MKAPVSDVARLERRLRRAEKARDALESLLELRSRELFEANQLKISLNERLRRECEFIESVVSTVPIGIAVVDESGQVQRANPGFYRLFALDPADDLAAQARLDSLPDALMEAGRLVAEGGPPSSFEIEIDAPAARLGNLVVDCFATRLQGTAERPDVLLMLHDVTERKRVERDLVEQTMHDPLTGMINRAGIALRLDRLVERTHAQPDQPFAVLFVDLDRFKAVNDEQGHEAGDDLLQQVAGRLQDCVRSDDSAGRIGGDEFVILLSHVQRVEDATLVADRIVASLSKPFDLGERTASISASVGIANSNGGFGSAEEILANADQAMYEAKSLGRGRHVTFGQSHTGEGE